MEEWKNEIKDHVIYCKKTDKNHGMIFKSCLWRITNIVNIPLE